MPQSVIRLPIPLDALTAETPFDLDGFHRATHSRRTDPLLSIERLRLRRVADRRFATETDMSTDIARLLESANAVSIRRSLAGAGIHELNYLVPRLARTQGKTAARSGLRRWLAARMPAAAHRLRGVPRLRSVAADLLRDIDPRIHTAVFDITQSRSASALSMPPSSPA